MPTCTNDTNTQAGHSVALSAKEKMTRAAERLAELDRIAQHAPWKALCVDGSVAVAVPVDECTCRARGRDGWPHEEGCGHNEVCYPDRKSDAPLIAVMRSTAVPLAKLLARTASEFEKLQDDCCPCVPVDGWHELEEIAEAVLSTDTDGIEAWLRP